MNEHETQPTTHHAAPSQPLPSTAKPARSIVVPVAFVVIVLAFCAGMLGSFAYDKLSPDTTTSTTVPSKDDGNLIVTKEEENIASVASKVSPSVVSIVATSSSRSVYGSVQSQGAGTGVIISKDGYILTNNHVVSGSYDISVIDASGETYDDVKLVGRDPLNDIAFLKINGVSDLKPAVLGDSKSIRIGQKVVAIGNALGQYQNTVTSGIISGIGRTVTATTDGGYNSDAETLDDLIQTDAAINSGNSGGPLVNMSGQIIGINTAVATDANSVGFVIPISATKGVIQSVLKTGKVSRAYLGIRYLTITPDIAKEYKLSVKTGAYVFSDAGRAVVAGGPADQAGIKEKDIIVKVNGVDVGARGSVSTLIGEVEAGQEVELTVLRGSSTRTLTITPEVYRG